ncbi:hypothetical protein WJX77_000872 [Trebouxia sp. C0004]
MKKFNNQKQTVSVWQESVQQRFGFASKGAAAVIDNNAHTATRQTAHELVGGSTTAGIQSSDQEHLNDTAKAGAYAKIKSDQVVRPNGYGTEKAGCAPGPDLTKSQQSELLAKMRQPISGSHSRPSGKRTRRWGVHRWTAAAELEEEAEISSTASSDADGDEDPQEMYDSGSGRD